MFFAANIEYRVGVVDMYEHLSQNTQVGEESDGALVSAHGNMAD